MSSMELSGMSLLLLPALWICVAFGLGFASGWRRLAKCYSGEEAISGEARNFQSAAIDRLRLPRTWPRFSAISYSCILSMKSDGQSVQLSVFFPLRPGHPRLIIPLKDISAIRKKGLFMILDEWILAKDPTVTIEVKTGVTDWLMKISSDGLAFKNEVSDRE